MNDIFNKKANIVLIDDEIAILNGIKSLLRRYYNVYTFTNPVEALSYIDSHEVDLLITDEMMPEMKGSDLVRIVNEKHPDICQIILSGHSEKENIAKAINSGRIFAFLFKPTDNSQLMQAISRGLESKKMRYEIKEKNEQLEKSNKNLEQTVKDRTEQIVEMEKFYEVGKFSASIVHNLNNPLQSLIMAIQMLETELDMKNISDTKIDRYVDMLNDGMMKMGKMIKSITSNVRTGKFGKDEEIDINYVIKSSIEFMKMHHDFKHETDLDLVLTENLPKIMGQEIHFSQIFSNLIKNSIDAMEADSDKSMKITTELIDDMIRITLQDNGCGIPDNNLEKIFETGFTTKPPGKGTGLGLPITKQMVESYKGRIDVSSKSGEGTVFTLLFPAG